MDADQDRRIRLKKRHFTWGLYGFIISLVSFGIVMFFHIPLAVLSAFIPEVCRNSVLPLLNGLEGFLGILLPFFFTMALASFGALVASLFQKPRDLNPSEFFRGGIMGVLLVFAGGASLMILLGLLPVLILMVILFIQDWNVLFLSLACFFFSALYFMLAGLWTILRKTAASRSFDSDSPRIDRLLFALKLRKADDSLLPRRERGEEDSAMEDTGSRRISRGYILTGGIVLFMVIMQFSLWEEAGTLLEKHLGKEKTESLFQKALSPEALSGAAAFLVFGLAVMMGLKAYRLLSPRR